ncbi:MAG: hypothetical protein JSV22_01295 [Bacteroidales bacterium]|nr:MAG: hypothetical protein JSV22_01295 [Bacteroidales bacterium]
MKDNKKDNKNNLLINSISFILFTILTLYLTVINNKIYLFKLQDLSLFLPTKMFFLDKVSTPGGFLSYLGLFFTQFFYYPWLGGFIFIFFLFVVQFLTAKAFKLHKNYYPLSFIPSLILLLVLSHLGYNIYILYSEGIVFSNLFGIIMVLGAFWIYRSINKSNLRLLFSLIFITILFHLTGFYSLLTVLLFVVFEIIAVKNDYRNSQFIIIILPLIFALGIPFLFSRFLYLTTIFPNVYIAALPAFGITGDLILYLPFVALFAFLILVVFNFLPTAKTQRPNRLFYYIPAFVFLLVIIGVYLFSYDDENFRTELAMEQAIFENEWEEVLDLSRELKGEPTRLIVMSTYLALRKLHIAGDKMFTYKNGNKYFNTRSPILQMEIAGKMFYFQYGKINYCYRWCMEDMINNGMKVENLKYFVKCCLLNGEIPLAKKYNDVLMKTLFHKSWATKYQQLIENPEEIINDSEFSEIIPLLDPVNRLYTDKVDRLEDFLTYSFAFINAGTSQLIELSLQYNLEFKNSERFWLCFAYYVKKFSRIPVHYQEAALLYAYLEGNVDLSRIKFDSEVLNNFTKFVNMMKQYSHFSKEKLEPIFFKNFGGTYWYYYFFFEQVARSR